MIGFNQEKNQMPEEFKNIAKDFSEKGFITTSSNNLITSSCSMIALGSEILLFKDFKKSF